MRGRPRKPAGTAHRKGHDAPHLRYRFCMTCGVRAFGVGDAVELGGKFFFVSVAALDQSPEQFASIPIRYENGRDGRYEQTPEHTSWM